MDAGEHDLILIRQAVGGDSAALDFLLAEIHPRLCSNISRRISARFRRIIDAEDVVQETKIVVCRRIGSFKPGGPDSFYRWVATIALSQLRDAIKRQRTVKRGGGTSHVEGRARRIEDSTIALLDKVAGRGDTPSRSVARGEAVQAVEAALGELPAHYRQAVRLVHIEGRAVAEVAAEMGITRRAVNGLCRRGLKQLQVRLQSASRFLSSSG